MHSPEQPGTLLDRYAGMPVAQATLSRDLDELGASGCRRGRLEVPGCLRSRPGTAFDYPERTVPPPQPPAKPGTSSAEQAGYARRYAGQAGNGAVRTGTFLGERHRRVRSRPGSG